MQSALSEFGLSILANLIVWLLTARVSDWFRAQSWRVHVPLIGATIGATILVVALIRAPKVPVGETYNTPPNASIAPDNGEGLSHEKTESTRLATPEDRFIQEYLGAPGDSSLADRSWAVVLREGETPAPSQLIGAVAEALNAKAYKVVPVFRAEIFKDAGYGQLFGADSSLLEKLKRHCHGVIIGELTGEYSTNEGLQSVVTARLALNARVYQTEPPQEKAFHISEKGGGFSRETALAQAADRLAQKLRERILEEVR